mmetsp:Transcript_21129/g.29849  ORF Transcript_21129/g.29849 Transcript_21129/m.29849 type:complete len:113 (-) Transcript_21129:849-1187(-)
MATNRSHQAGSNLTPAAILALLSYVPFEYVAKFTLILCVLLFVLDPFPPTSRLVSLIATVVVALIARQERQFREQQQQEEELVEGSKEEVTEQNEQKQGREQNDNTLKEKSN